jgi:hypothetical protein
MQRYRGTYCIDRVYKLIFYLLYKYGCSIIRRLRNPFHEISSPKEINEENKLAN